MRNIIKILILFIIAISLIGCEKKMDEEYRTMQYEVDILNNEYSLYIDNDVSTEIMKNSYKLSKLNEYFECYYSYKGFNKDFESKTLEISEINNAYPLEIIRINKNIIYTLYKVNEGGLFYVFFTLTDEDEIVIKDCVYIDELKMIDDFNTLENEHSTIDDVINISTATELKLNLSRGIFSYTLLKNNEILEIEYKEVDYLGIKTLLVIDKKIVKNAPTDLQYIYAKDLTNI